jgi:hypothetical protein
LLRLNALSSVTKKFGSTDLKYGGLFLPPRFKRQRGSCPNPFIQNSVEVTIDELLLNHNLLLLPEFLFAFDVRLFVNFGMKIAYCKRTTKTLYSKWKQAKQGKFAAVKRGVICQTQQSACKRHHYKSTIARSV